jgi:hypothetical protein
MLANNPILDNELHQGHGALPQEAHRWHARRACLFEEG